MAIDQAKLINVVIEKNTKKISELQTQVIILEAQLQLVEELNRTLQEQADKAKKREPKSEFSS